MKIIKAVGVWEIRLLWRKFGKAVFNEALRPFKAHAGNNPAKKAVTTEEGKENV